ncbi:unnamed protein product, partial [Mycena citricolor]
MRWILDRLPGGFIYSPAVQQSYSGRHIEPGADRRLLHLWDIGIDGTLLVVELDDQPKQLVQLLDPGQINRLEERHLAVTRAADRQAFVRRQLPVAGQPQDRHIRPGPVLALQRLNLVVPVTILCGGRRRGCREPSTAAGSRSGSGRRRVLARRVRLRPRSLLLAHRDPQRGTKHDLASAGRPSRQFVRVDLLVQNQLLHTAARPAAQRRARTPPQRIGGLQRAAQREGSRDSTGGEVEGICERRPDRRTPGRAESAQLRARGCPAAQLLQRWRRRCDEHRHSLFRWKLQRVRSRSSRQHSKQVRRYWLGNRGGVRLSECWRQWFRSRAPEEAIRLTVPEKRGS